MAWRSFWSGLVSWMRAPRRPGRSKASSKSLMRCAVAINDTLSARWTPSISMSNVPRTRSNEPSEVVSRPRGAPSESNWSSSTTHGACSRASAMTARTLRSDAPSVDCSRPPQSTAMMLKPSMHASRAMARASVVLPVPVSPYSTAPHPGRRRMASSDRSGSSVASRRARRRRSMSTPARSRSASSRSFSVSHRAAPPKRACGAAAVRLDECVTARTTAALATTVLFASHRPRLCACCAMRAQPPRE
mmetsp:Transcript_19301/g.65212  ORF Transcript_19301/g.65212 Transcript_19301/m.65212 type:complete len:247 (+) Transcript_19301:2095-2835(+)